MIFIRYFTTFGMNTNVVDTMWQYDQSKKIADGLVSYKDFNMITTPLYYWISAISIKIRRSFISKLLLDDLLMICYYYVLYKVTTCFRVLNVSKLVYLSISMMSLNFGYAYNTLSLLFVLLILYLRYTVHISNKLLVFIGVLTGLSLLTKQTIGFVLFIVVCIDLFISKELSLKNLMYYVVGVASIGILFVLYLIVTESIVQFFDYCLFGATSFIDNFYVQDYGLGLLVFTVINISVFVYTKLICQKDYIYNKLLLYLIVFIQLSIPIIDFTHDLEIYVMSLLLLFLLDIDGIKFITKLKLFQLPISFYFLLLSLGVIGQDTIYFKNMKFQNYAYDYICKETDEIKYLENLYNKPVMLLATKYTYLAEFYDVDIDNVFNLFLHGNIGTKSSIEWTQQFLDEEYIVAVSEIKKTNVKTQVCEEVPVWLEDNAKLLYYSESTKMYYYVKDN